MFHTSTSMAQCFDTKTVDKCSDRLTDHHLFKVRAIPVPKGATEKNPLEFMIPFKKNTDYVMTLCDMDTTGGALIMLLRDRTGKPVATNYDKKTKKYYDKLVFKCQSTSRYYLDFWFPDRRKGCDVVSIGFSL